VIKPNSLRKIGFILIDKTDVSREFYLHKSPERFLVYYPDTCNVFLNGEHVGNSRELDDLKTYLK
jgi:hypothetical protein